MFALYATGGHAREQGFDDDYDMIAILDSTDSETFEYCSKIVAKMNSHILKRGIIPHYRFAEHFGSYVISINELADYLKYSSEDLFIDQSQILTSRMLVGSRKLDNKLHETIVIPLIYENKWKYIEQVKKEMNSRHEKIDESHCNNVKECPGGLRDIEMLLLMYKAKYESKDPLSRKFLRRVIVLEPRNAEKLIEIEKHLNFVKNLRDLYRLKIAAHNVIELEYLSPIAATMGYGDDEKGAKKLHEDFWERSRRVSDIIGRLANEIRP